MPSRRGQRGDAEWLNAGATVTTLPPPGGRIRRAGSDGSPPGSRAAGHRAGIAAPFGVPAPSVCPPSVRKYPSAGLAPQSRLTASQGRFCSAGALIVAGGAGSTPSGQLGRLRGGPSWSL